jgi:hypothetical protein
MKKQKDLSPWWLLVALLVALKAVNLIADKYSI